MLNIDAVEKLLRVALFSDSLQPTAAKDRTDSLIKTRQEIARSARIGRRKGVIGVLLSQVVFVIALAISIYAAFGEIEIIVTAIDLGLGLLLAWLPILVLSSIIDRNPVAADEIRDQLNNLLDLVRAALLDPERRTSYIKTIGKTEGDFAWTKFLGDEHYFHNAFFTQFAGQGRLRWHVRISSTFTIVRIVLTYHQHGCAHSILSSMEDAWIADHGRGWMDNADRARTQMISHVEPNHQELVWFDRQMFWQIAGSTAILYSTSGGAFILACEKTLRQQTNHPSHTELSQFTPPPLVSVAGLATTSSTLLLLPAFLWLRCCCGGVEPPIQMYRDGSPSG